MLRPILASYVPIADMLAATFGDSCEVVLHDLSDPEHSVVYVANDKVTGRKVGQSFDQLVRQVILSDQLKDNYVANYYFTAADGRQIRSSTLLIHGADGNLEGALCINLDTEPVLRQIQFLQAFLPGKPLEQGVKIVPHIEGHVEDMVDELIHRIMGSKPPEQLSRDERIEKVKFMDAKGIFLMKGSIDKVAEILGVNKVTVYSYLDEIRKKAEE